MGLLLLAGPALSLACADDKALDSIDRIPKLETQNGDEAVSPLERLKRRSPSRQWKETLKWRRQESESAQPEPAEPHLQPFELRPETQPVRTAPAPVLEDQVSVSKQEAAPVPRVATGISKWIEGTNVAPRMAALEARLPQIKDPIRDPKNLKKLTDILPYADYEPDLETRASDPCKYLCPRPDNADCKPSPIDGIPQCPEIVSLGTEPYESRVFPESMFTWAASNVYHNPLYFEDPALERYGHTVFEPIQPFISAGRFGAQLLGLPYQMSIDPVWKHQYALGWYRPGDFAPYKIYQIPWNTRAALDEAGVMTGLFYLFP